MNPIGGFFELELPSGSGPYHAAATALTSGRACLRLALSALRPARVHVPFYVCNALLESLGVLGLRCAFYPLDEQLEPEGGLEVAPGEVALVVNYFGLKRPAVRALAGRLGEALIVDNVQAFFEVGYPKSWSFNSARKFFGVPDGAYLYAPFPVAGPAERNQAPAWDYLIGRLEGRQAEAFRRFAAAEAEVTSEPRRLSVGAERLLAAIDYPAVAAQRRANFVTYEAALGWANQLALPLPSGAVPLCYPFLPHRMMDRRALYERGIYPPMYWPDCLDRPGREFEWERDLSARLLPLPVDQRYGANDIGRVVAVVTELLEGLTCARDSANWDAGTSPRSIGGGTIHR